jgi:hypothetical protein
MTAEGIDTIAAPLSIHASKFARLVIGALTWRAFDALDRLFTAGAAWATSC